MKEEFYMIYVEGKMAPTQQHDSASAKKEAERLASINPGVNVFVLKAISRCINKTVTWEDLSPEVPF